MPITYVVCEAGAMAVGEERIAGFTATTTWRLHEAPQVLAPPRPVVAEDAGPELGMVWDSL